MSMLFMVDGADSLADDLEGEASWRREKAKEYPEDTRNLRAAELLERLAAELRSGNDADELVTLEKAVDEYLATYDRSETYEDGLSERMSEYMRSVGFHTFPAVSDLLSDLRDMLHEATAAHAGEGYGMNAVQDTPTQIPDSVLRATEAVVRKIMTWTEISTGSCSLSPEEIAQDISYHGEIRGVPKEWLSDVARLAQMIVAAVNREIDKDGARPILTEARAFAMANAALLDPDLRG